MHHVWLLLLLCGVTGLSLLTGCGGGSASSPPPEPLAPTARVLLIGDSISIGYLPHVRKALAHVALVDHVGENARSTAYALTRLPVWLGAGEWQVIHVNFGLHDIILNANSIPTVPLAQYETNLREIVRIIRERQPHARLVWASTTPVPPVPVQPARRDEDVVQYYHAAARVMAELQVPVGDLYSAIFPDLTRYQLPANVHFSSDGYAALARHAAAGIQIALAE